jgi:hypothetical protein
MTTETVTHEHDKSVPQESLHLAGHATDHIWGMAHGDDCIGLRVDCGDAGTLYMTKEQAREVIDTLLALLEKSA